MPVLILLLLGGGIAAITTVVVAAMDKERPLRNYEPDVPVASGPGPVAPGVSKSTGYRRVDAIMDELRKAATSSGIPLGLLVGWIARECGGKLAEHPQPGPGDTSLDERGYFQLTPEESASLGLDHKQLSTDSVYSIAAGLKLIAKCMGTIDRYGIAPKGTSFYWRLVKLVHTMGSGDTDKIIKGAKAAGLTESWESFSRYARSGAAHTRHNPNHWFDLIDKVYEVGKPFGFGSDQPASVGEIGILIGAGQAFSDIVDPLDALSVPLRRLG
jgi:hypothetical protein